MDLDKPACGIIDEIIDSSTIKFIENWVRGAKTRTFLVKWKLHDPRKKRTFEKKRVFLTRQWDKQSY